MTKQSIKKIAAPFIRQLANSMVRNDKKRVLMNYFIYIMANSTNTVLYTGVTNNLAKRVFEHKSKLTHGFTSKYNVNKLVYFEQTSDINSAIAREKQIKGGSRKKKVDLITNDNPEFQDLYQNII